MTFIPGKILIAQSEIIPYTAGESGLVQVQCGGDSFRSDKGIAEAWV